VGVSVKSPAITQPERTGQSDFALNRIFLLFRDPRVEADFAARSLVTSMPFIRSYLLAAIGIYVVFGFLDARVAPDSLEQMWTIRYGMAVPAMLAVFALTFWREFSRYVQPALAFAMTAGGLGVAAMCAILPPPYHSYYYAGLIMVAVYCGTLLGMRFVYSASVTLGMLAVYQVISLWINPIDATDYISNNFFLTMATGVGIFSSYVLETHIRNNYIAQKIIEEKNRVMSDLLDEAEAANRAKSEFLAVMSHELRTPLNAILGFSEMIKEQFMGPLGSPKYVEYAGDIHSSGKHLLAIIGDILDLAKAESGKLELAESEFDLAATIEATLKMCRPKADEGDVKLNAAPVPAGVRLFADERLICQVALNLVSNAVKFTPPGGKVGIDIRPLPNGGLELVVSDTGIGIATKDLDRVLRPFEQVESALARNHGGTGLGLPYAKQVVEIHGGTLTLSSQVNQGTTVRVELPAARVRTPALELRQTG
jgi:two-component system, cell cycle sensor histidine kinase PleC